MPTFTYSVELDPDANIGNLADTLRAVADRIERGGTRETLLNTVGSFEEYYDLENPDKSYASKSEKAAS